MSENLILPHYASEEAGWRYLEPAPRGTTILLLTTGNSLCKGQWDGRPWQYYKAWSPLLKRDKELEKELERIYGNGYSIQGEAPETDLLVAAASLGLPVRGR